LEALKLSDPNRFTVLSFAENRGKAEAVRQGILTALTKNPHYVGFWDADLATPLDAIPSFIEVAETFPNFHIIFGSRVKLLGRQIDRQPLRHYLGRVFATMVSLALGIGIYDSQCGAKLFRTLPEIMDLFHMPFGSRWIFDVEIIARMIQARRRKGLLPAENHIYELPLMVWQDVRGSKVKGCDFVRAAFELAQIYKSYLLTA
jgi:glycosyltransferase involved in cell wall biosynthesis